MPYFHVTKEGHIDPSNKFDTVGEAVAAATPFVSAVVKVEEVRTFPRKLTEGQRSALMEFVDLADYAQVCVCGDGLEYDRAEDDFLNMTDEELIDIGFKSVLMDDERADVVEKIREKDPALADVLIELMKEN